MHQTLNVILKYLEEGGKLLDGRKGIVWIYNPSPKLDKAIKEGASVWIYSKEKLLMSYCWKCNVCANLLRNFIIKILQNLLLNIY